MARPAGGYRLDPKDPRTRVPGVTTVIGRYGDSGGLVHWAWKLGMEGKDYRAVSKEACSAGHLAHDLVEEDLHGRTPIIPDGTDEEVERLAVTGYDAYRNWKDNMNLEVICTEHGLVSQALRVGGTLDAVAWTGKRKRLRTLLDWKTTNASRPSHIIQLAAYSAMWNEAYPDQPIQAWQSLRIGKEHADFHFHSFGEEQMETALEAFHALREMYELEKEIKKWL